jgi:hypothetical protein
MKKSVFLIGFVLLLSACTSVCPYDHLVSETYEITVHPRDWMILDDGPNYYIYAPVGLPALTRDVIREGIVSAYYIEEGLDNPLPYLRSYQNILYEVVRFDMKAGEITFIIESNDSRLPPIPNDYDMLFKVVVVHTVKD